MGVDVEKGILRIGTPIVVYDKEVLLLCLEKTCEIRKSDQY
jgi:hypothetical protein